MAHRRGAEYAEKDTERQAIQALTKSKREKEATAAYVIASPVERDEAISLLSSWFSTAEALRTRRECAEKKLSAADRRG